MRRATRPGASEITGGRAEIASMIAHELRGPVTTVKGLATTGARHYDSLGDAERREFFELIDQESRRLLHIVDETSMALKIDAGTVTYDIRPEDLAVVVADGVAQGRRRRPPGRGRRRARGPDPARPAPHHRDRARSSWRTPRTSPPPDAPIVVRARAGTAARR